MAIVIGLNFRIHRRDEHPRSCATAVAAQADDDADEAVEGRGGAAQTSGQARPGGRSEPARLFAAEQRLIVLIEGNQSCRGTIPQPAQAGSNVVSHQRLPHTALAWLEQYPYRSLPTLPTHKFVVPHFRSC